MEKTASTEIKQLREWVNSARRIAFFGGAGVSTESGIPDFRRAYTDLIIRQPIGKVLGSLFD